MVRRLNWEKLDGSMFKLRSNRAGRLFAMRNVYLPIGAVLSCLLVTIVPHFPNARVSARELVTLPPPVTATAPQLAQQDESNDPNSGQQADQPGDENSNASGDSSDQPNAQPGDENGGDSSQAGPSDSDNGGDSPQMNANPDNSDNANQSNQDPDSQNQQNPDASQQ
jgi:hypothetical protein